MKATGINATWLPLACDPAINRWHEVPKRFDLSFVDNLFPGRRQSLRRLQDRVPNMFIGRRYGSDMAEVHSASRIVFNCSIKNDVNMREFKAMASGSLLLTNDLSDNRLDEMFLDGVHLTTYRDAEEMADKAAFYLRREDVRERIAAAGRAEVLEKHTYRHRMERVLGEFESLFERRFGRKVLAPRQRLTQARSPAGRGDSLCSQGAEAPYYEEAGQGVDITRKKSSKARMPLNGYPVTFLDWHILQSLGSKMCQSPHVLTVSG